MKALTQAGTLELIEGECDDGHDWYQDLSFREIPGHLLKRSLWSDCMSGSWREPEDISVEEIRTVVKAVFDSLKFPHVHNQRHLFLGDNMGVVLACARARSKSFKFIVQLRKLCALSLISNIRVYFRWIPSEINLSDKAFRFF